MAVFSCSVHGECSLSRYCQHQTVMACNRCNDRKPPVHVVNSKLPLPPINRDRVLNHIIYHVMPLSGDAEPIWRKHIDWIRSVRGNYNGRLILGVVTRHPNDPWGYCPPEAVQEAAKGLGAEFVIVENDGKPDPDTRGRHFGTQGEGATFLRMLEMLQTHDPDTTITYGHCKGVTRWDAYHGPAPHLWAQACFDVTFRNLRDVLESLDSVPICGPFRMHGGYRAGLPGLGTHWFFSGTFFAMRAAQVFSRNWRKLRKHYGNVEQWPRFLFSMETETRCLFFDSVTNLYDQSYWENEVTPAFEKWKSDHGIV